jgi:hypothetical protein
MICDQKLLQQELLAQILSEQKLLEPKVKKEILLKQNCSHKMF